MRTIAACSISLNTHVQTVKFTSAQRIAPEEAILEEALMELGVGSTYSIGPKTYSC